MKSSNSFHCHLFLHVNLIFLTIFKHLRGDGDAVMAFMAEMANFAK